MAEEPEKHEDGLTSSEAMLSDIAADVAKILKHTTFLAYLVWGLIGLWVVTVLLNVVA